ncbi:MAG: nuclear transport factor 2 family protein [Moraxella sp.]|nr:nuclear transport factor 2 family protein [Moraxella sp.]
MKRMMTIAGIIAATTFLTACNTTTNHPVKRTNAMQMTIHQQLEHDRQQTERNKANVLAFYEMAFNQHKVQQAVNLYVGDKYLQHNPTVADGGQAFVNAFAPFLAENAGSRAVVKRVAADGDLVWVHVHSTLNADDAGEAVVDIFRLDNDGKIIEHWDVIQAVPSETASGRSMF